MNQSEFEAITCNRRKARKNVRVQVAIGFSFPSRWLKRGNCIGLCVPRNPEIYRSKREFALETADSMHHDIYI